jgi:hypothetical protein
MDAGKLFSQGSGAEKLGGSLALMATAIVKGATTLMEVTKEARAAVAGQAEAGRGVAVEMRKATEAGVSDLGVAMISQSKMTDEQKAEALRAMTKTGGMGAAKQREIAGAITTSQGRISAESIAQGASRFGMSGKESADLQAYLDQSGTGLQLSKYENPFELQSDILKQMSEATFDPERQQRLQGALTDVGRYVLPGGRKGSKIAGAAGRLVRSGRGGPTAEFALAEDERINTQQDLLNTSLSAEGSAAVMEEERAKRRKMGISRGVRRGEWDAYTRQMIARIPGLGTVQESLEDVAETRETIGSVRGDSGAVGGLETQTNALTSALRDTAQAVRQAAANKPSPTAQGEGAH